MPVPTPTSPAQTQTTVQLACDVPTGLTGPLTYQYERWQGAGLFCPAPVVVTPSDGGAGGTFNPSSLSFNTNGNAAPAAQTVTYTPSSAGDKTISFVDNEGLADPAGFTYQAYTPLTAPVLQPAQEITSSSVALAWSASTGGVAPLSYAVQYREAGGSVWLPFLPPVDTFADIVTGLNGGQAYEFRVVVTGQAGNTSVSNTVTATTLASGLCAILCRTRNGGGGLVQGCQVRATLTSAPDIVPDALLTQQVTEGTTQSDGATTLLLLQGHTYTVRGVDPELKTFLWRELLVPRTSSANLWELV